MNDFLQEDLAIFNKYAFTIDFATARQSEKAVEIQPEEETKANNYFKHEFNQEYWEMRDWKRDGELGFAIWKSHGTELEFFKLTGVSDVKSI